MLHDFRLTSKAPFWANVFRAVAFRPHEVYVGGKLVLFYRLRRTGKRDRPMRKIEVEARYRVSSRKSDALAEAMLTALETLRIDLFDQAINLLAFQISDRGPPAR